MYYQLNGHCQLVEGKLRGAIYDFHTGKVYSVNRGAVDLLNACREHTLEDLLDVSDPDDQVYLNFIDQLTAKGIGAFYIKQPQPITSTAAATNDKLDFLWLELTSCCNNKCLHCYAASGPCVNQDKIPHERWLSLISEARQAGATAIQLIGGEPLLYPGWRDLVKKAHAEGFELIEIFTNATLIDDECIQFFKDYKVSIATTIYADNAAVHDRVTLQPGSFDKTLQAIKKILAADIPLRIASIIMKANEDQAENIMSLCAELGVEVNPPDVVRPTGRGDDKDLLPQAYKKPPVKPPFHTDQFSFEAAQTNNSCLHGKLAITADGNVIPCIFARSQIYGNILTASLADILNGQPLQQCWHLTKDSIEKCKDCEYRYACHDCRPLAQGTDPAHNWLACSANCSYNPYTGKWEEE
ncbi:radical sam [Lucifera butyrica]|uniref:Radical sam n=1 Tax=Lucifera butyrica TaxID=1351585 RepID=A0A498R494_9FIRM|nr:radical SAM protein [Lucifera butyrica]VBB06251.1 radical sam [Lucifera butyrica]